MNKWEVWGLAAGTGSTKGAAPGAFTWRRYPSSDIPKRDWKIIISIKKVVE